MDLTAGSISSIRPNGSTGPQFAKHAFLPSMKEFKAGQIAGVAILTAMKVQVAKSVVGHLSSP